jgi:basic membrane protein A and related proteins
MMVAAPTRRPAEEPDPVTPRQRFLALALSAFALIAVVGVDAVGRLPSSQPSPGPSASVYDLTPRIAIVYDPGGRSAGFNELVWEGANRAAAVFDAELTEITANPSDTDVDREERLIELAEARNDPIFVVDPTYASAVAKVAPKYRSIWFGMLDDGSVDARNVIGIQFNEEQGSYLVGAAAALTSKTGKVGFIGAVAVPLLQKYEAGFTAGARAANPDVKVQVDYLSSPAGYDGVIDPADARKAALELYGGGADVIFVAGGNAADGVIQAAHDEGFWAIGADSDQYLTSDPSVRSAILTSMVKRADLITYTITMEVANGVPKDGNNVFGLDRGGVAYSTSGGFVDPIKAQLDAFAASIAAGEFVVPTKP